MGRDEAYEVLGLKPGANRDEVQISYKKLMQKLLPDAEGNDYLVLVLGYVEVPSALFLTVH